MQTPPVTDRDGHSPADVEKALRAIDSMVARSAKAQQKFAPGTAQHTLQENRIHALHVASALIAREQANSAPTAAFTRAELERAQAPIASLISKSEKAQGKLAQGSWQHTMLEENLHALRMAAPLLEAMLNQHNVPDATAKASKTPKAPKTP